MRGWLSLGLVAALGGCVPEPTGSDRTSQEIAAGRLLLVFFDSGFDEPPEDGILRYCATSQTGLCVTDSPDRVYPLDRIGEALTYSTDFYTVTMQPDGTGLYRVPSTGYQIGVRWMTQEWEDA